MVEEKPAEADPVEVPAVSPDLFDERHAAVRILDLDACLKCGSSDAWLPKMPNPKPTDWRCWSCNPPAKAFLVADRRGPTIERIRKREAEAIALVKRRELDSSVVSMERPICSLCGCRWVVETPSDAGVELRCWCCHAELGPEAIDFGRPSGITTESHDGEKRQRLRGQRRSVA